MLKRLLTSVTAGVKSFGPKFAKRRRLTNMEKMTAGIVRQAVLTTYLIAPYQARAVLNCWVCEYAC